jgi:hypothetical protein
VSRDLYESSNTCKVRQDFTGSDHELLELLIGKRIPHTKERSKRRQAHRLTYKLTNKRYQMLLQDEWSRLKNSHFDDSNVMYTRYMEAICRAADDTIGKRKEVPYQSREVREQMNACKA